MCINTLCVYKHPTISNWVLPTCPLHFFLSIFLLQFWLCWDLLWLLYFWYMGSYLPNQGLNPGPLHRELGALPTGSPGKSLHTLFLTPFLPRLFPFPLLCPHVDLTITGGSWGDHTLKLGGHNTGGFGMLSCLPSPAPRVSLSGHPHWSLPVTGPGRHGAAPSTHTEPGRDAGQTNGRIS